MLSIIPSNQFKKDLKLAKKRGLNLELLSVVVNTLAAQQPLDIKYHDHNLTGNYRDFRECHIEPDWLLVYRTDDDQLELFLFRTGTHSNTLIKKASHLIIRILWLTFLFLQICSNFLRTETTLC